MSSPDAPPPPKPIDVGENIISFAGGLAEAFPSLYRTESQWRPEFTGLNLQDISNFLGGVDGQPGILDLQEYAQGRQQEMLQGSREAELSWMQGAAPLFGEMLGGVSPMSEAFSQAAGAAALDRYGDAMSPQLTGEERRMSDQTAREAYADRGRLEDTSSVAAEILGRDQFRTEKRSRALQEATQLGHMASSTEQAYRTSPSLALLTGTPVGTALGQTSLQQGFGAVGSALPQLISPDAGINIGMMNNQAQQQWQNSVYGANAAYSTQMQGAGLAAGGAIIAAMISDERLKTDIERIGTHDVHDIGIYKFRYNWEPEGTIHVGVLAQEVKETIPEAVIENHEHIIDGEPSLAVDLTKL